MRVPAPGNSSDRRSGHGSPCPHRKRHFEMAGPGRCRDGEGARTALPAFRLRFSAHSAGGAVAAFHKGRDFAREIVEASKSWDFDLIEHKSLIESDGRDPGDHPFGSESWRSGSTRTGPAMSLPSNSPRYCPRESEGRRGQDDDGDQSRHGIGRDRRGSADRRPRSAGQCVDRPGDRSQEPDGVDLRPHAGRHDRRGFGRRDRRTPRFRHPLDARPPRGGAGDRRPSRSDVPPPPGARSRPGGFESGPKLHLCPHRLPALAQSADHQCHGRGALRPGAAPVRVLRPRGTEPAPAHRRAGSRSRSIRN